MLNFGFGGGPVINDVVGSSKGFQGEELFSPKFAAPAKTLVVETGATMMALTDGAWSAAPTAKNVNPPRFRFGGAVPEAQYLFPGNGNYKPGLFDLHVRENDIWVPARDMHPNVVQPSKGVFNLQPAADFITRARQYGKAVRGHLIMYPAHDWSWVDGTTVTSATYKGLIDAQLDAWASMPGI